MAILAYVGILLLFTAIGMGMYLGLRAIKLI